MNRVVIPIQRSHDRDMFLYWSQWGALQRTLLSMGNIRGEWWAAGFLKWTVMGYRPIMRFLDMNELPISWFGYE
jgi:hypothetical protein